MFHTCCAFPMADVATIGLLQHRAIEHRQVLAEQLQGALNSRVLVEQAKEVVAERLHLGMPESFEAMRAYARRRHQRLSVCRTWCHRRNR